MIRTHSVNAIRLVLLCTVALGASSARAGSDALDYPELVVVPRASERLAREAGQEYDRRFTTHLPIAASALTTLASGLLQSSGADPSKDQHSNLAGIVVGGAWLAVAAALSVGYTPYADGWRDVNALPKGSQRDAIARERAAEEALRSPARLAWKLRVLSIVTNLGASAYMAGNADTGSFSRVLDGASMAMALAPLVFGYRWTEVAATQEDYKKRIYGPVAGVSYLRDPISGRTTPGLTLAFRF